MQTVLIYTNSITSLSHLYRHIISFSIANTEKSYLTIMAFASSPSANSWLNNQIIISKVLMLDVYKRQPMLS